MITDRMGKELALREICEKTINRLYNYWLDFVIMLLGIVGHIPSHVIRQTVYRMAGIKLGKKSTIHMGANFFQPANIKIGEDTIIGRNAFLDGRDKLMIGNHVDIASDVLIYNSEHDIDSKDFSAIVAPVEIGDYVFVGPRTIILPGVKVGKGAVIAAGAVVSINVPDFSIVGGVPGKVIGERKDKNPNYRLGRARLFQ